MKTKYLREYATEKTLHIADVSVAFAKAVLDEVSEVLVTKEEYSYIVTSMCYYGQWDWDRETFMGIKITVVNN